MINPQFFQPPQVTFQLQPARIYLEDTFVYYIKTLFHTYIPSSATAETQRSQEPRSAPVLPEQVLYLKCLFFGTAEAERCHGSHQTLKCLPGPSVSSGVGPPCSAAEVGHPASQPVGQHPRLSKAVHRFRPHSSVLLCVWEGAAVHHSQTAGPRSGHALRSWSSLPSRYVLDEKSFCSLKSHIRFRLTYVSCTDARLVSCSILLFFSSYYLLHQLTLEGESFTVIGSHSLAIKQECVLKCEIYSH